MRLARQSLEFGLRKTPVDHVKFHRETESACSTWADRDAAGHCGAFGILFLLTGDVIYRASETGRISGGK